MPYTPGPWYVEADLNGNLAVTYHIITNERQYSYAIARLGHPTLAENAWDNANLIAAAPDLLKACAVLLHEFEHIARNDPHFQQGYGSAVLPTLFGQARAAIARATGDPDPTIHPLEEHVK